jgi:NAD(P)-dependent dehydrogenase (short-subunit alcohol dehydrogenase family)
LDSRAAATLIIADFGLRIADSYSQSAIRNPQSEIPMSTFLEKLFGLDGQVAVVIGGTGVLGGELCKGLAQAGAHVVVAGRSAERGQACVEAIGKLGGTATFIDVDACSRESVAALLQKTLDGHGRVDALVNCAGVNSPTPYFDITDEEFHRIISTNLLATHLGCQIFGKHMVDAGCGTILNIGSVTSYRPLSRVFIYSASKAGVLNLTQNVAREFAPHGVRVNCLCPGFFPAEQNRKILDKSRVESILRHTPMGRLGDGPELVGAALLLLAPVAGSFITGEAIYVDGGFTAMTI